MRHIDPQVVLSNYPLSGEFRAQLEKRLGGAVRFISAAELRQGSGAWILGRLLRIRAASLLIATEDSASQAMLPVLQLLAALTRARRRSGAVCPSSRTWRVSQAPADSTKAR